MDGPRDQDVVSQPRSASSEAPRPDRPTPITEPTDVSGVRGPLPTPSFPILEMRRNAQARKEPVLAAVQNSDKKKNAIAIFIVSGDADATKGVAKAVYQDLKDGNTDANIRLEETQGPYIRVEASTEEDALILTRTAQSLTTDYLSSHTTDSKPIFVEPPTSCVCDFNIAAKVVNDTGYARAMAEAVPGTVNTTLESDLRKYKHETSRSILEALEKASGVHRSLILKIHLGQYLLERYQKGKFPLERFVTMVRNPRALGRFDVCLGKEPYTGGIGLGEIIRRIQAPDSPCFPIDNQTPTAADVVPTYVLESWHDGDKYETDLEMVRGGRTRANDPPRFDLVHTKMIPQDAQVPRAEAVSINVGRRLDWTLKAFPVSPKDQEAIASPVVRLYFRRGKAVLKGSLHNFTCFPEVQLPENQPLAGKLKPITMKRICRYSWKNTGYVIQITVNWRWQSIRDMKRNNASVPTDFDIVVYADNWDYDSQAEAGRTVGGMWGRDLAGLLHDEPNDAAKGACGRLEKLIETLQDILDFVEGPNHA
ncbi:hypothetical protein F4777DRAFT_573791 [Nemania sp. FL0916]|nr:hypothetical protein F4777DRAFT_573791 [Nemania sp. FL0916]